MRGKAYFVLVPVFYLVISLTGSIFTREGLPGWYEGLAKPSYTPPGGLIAAAWTVIYVLTAISFILFLNKTRDGRMGWLKWDRRLVASLYLLNGIINASWSFVFFGGHLLFHSFLVALAIVLSTVLMAMLLPRYSLAATLLLIPYIAWSSFATFLAYEIYRLNR